MRIIDQLEHPSMRISIFQMNLKYILKLEWGPLEQSYKFECMDYKDLESFKASVNTDAFLRACMTLFIQMKSSYDAIV